jgi:hypothetical protein
MALRRAGVFKINVRPDLACLWHKRGLTFSAFIWMEQRQETAYLTLFWARFFEDVKGMDVA